MKTKIADLAKQDLKNPWIKWEGGLRPVLLHQWVEIKFPDGETDILPACDVNWKWKHKGQTGGDVVSYRKVSAPKK